MSETTEKKRKHSRNNIETCNIRKVRGRPKKRERKKKKNFYTFYASNSPSVVPTPPSITISSPKLDDRSVLAKSLRNDRSSGSMTGSAVMMTGSVMMGAWWIGTGVSMVGPLVRGSVVGVSFLSERLPLLSLGAKVHLPSGFGLS